jgi:hypothetical protein
MVAMKAGETGLALRAKQALAVYGATSSGLQALGSFVFPGLGWGGTSETWGSFQAGWMGVSPRDFPYEQVNGYNSSVVMACVNAIVAGFKWLSPYARIQGLSADGTKVRPP